MPRCACSSSSRPPTRRTTCGPGGARRSGAGSREVPDVAPGRLWTVRPVKWLPRRLDRRADERLARAVMRAADSLGMRHPLLWINDPGAVALAERSGWPTLYDITDDWLAADRSASRAARAAANEARLLELAREVVVCSPELVRRKSTHRSGHAHPERRRCRGLPPPRAAAGGPARRAGRALPRHRAPRPHRRRPVRGDRASARCGRHARARRPEPARSRAGRAAARCGRASARPAPARRGDRLPAARRRARRAARRHRVHRQPRPHQALRVPGRRPPGRVDSGRGVP